MSGCLLASCLVLVLQLIPFLQGYSLSHDDLLPMQSNQHSAYSDISPLEDEISFQMDSPQKSRHKLLGLLRLQGFSNYPSVTRDLEDMESLETGKRYKPMSAASQENYRKYLSQIRTSPTGSSNYQPGLQRRDGPGLSIVNPLDVLRQQMLLNLAKQAQQRQAEQIKTNQEILDRAGKRSVDPEQDEDEARSHRQTHRGSVSYNV